jgi:hypothetical protein
LKIDKTLAALTKRVENLLGGSSPTSKWDNGPTITTISNWDIINNTIKEHPDDSWFVPKENIINCWTCLVNFTLGNIELRDFALERKFHDMRIARVEEYDRKWDEALQRNDKEYLDKHPSFALAPTFWSNWSKEELEYYENEERFPNLKQEGYKPNWKLLSS